MVPLLVTIGNSPTCDSLSVTRFRWLAFGDLCSSVPTLLSWLIDFPVDFVAFFDFFLSIRFTLSFEVRKATSLRSPFYSLSIAFVAFYGFPCSLNQSAPKWRANQSNYLKWFEANESEEELKMTRNVLSLVPISRLNLALVFTSYC